jgi:hypothetical protein
MAGEERFRRWTLKESDLGGLTPVTARDFVIRYSFEARGAPAIWYNALWHQNLK